MLNSEKNRTNKNEKDNKLENVNVKSKVHDFALNLLIDTQFLNSQNPFQSNNVEVAIKVRHPQIEQQMAIDYEIVKHIVKMADSVGLRLLPNLNHALNEFESSLMDQINLKNEMKCIIKFNNNFYSDNSVVFPKPILSSESVIVESFQQGVNIGSYIKYVELLKESKFTQIQQFISTSTYTANQNDNDNNNKENNTKSYDNVV